MNYLNEYDKINEAAEKVVIPKWVARVRKSIKYENEKDIKMYFIELIDIFWEISSITYGLCGVNFELEEQATYVRSPLYKVYTFTFVNHKIHTMERIIEIMEEITSAMERLKDDGFLFRLKDLTLGKDQIGKKKIIIEILHTKDFVPFDIVFPPPPPPEKETTKLEPRKKPADRNKLKEKIKEEIIKARDENKNRQSQS